MSKIPGILVLLLALPVGATGQRPVATTSRNPVANPAAIVRAGHARFTVLTPRMIRMEWSGDDVFEDHASLVFLNRRLPVPAFRHATSHGWLTIRTDSLTLRYRPAGGRFDATNLEVRRRLDGRDVVWRPGMPDTANLKGTARTLDGAKGPIPLEDGLVSRAGWTVVDDSRRPLFDDSDPPWVLPRPDTTRIDWYFFGYGHDYAGALRDFTRVAGRIPMPP
ncbi:MAG: alpha-glucosidase, partial [Gemmatimonadota bacterium]